MNKLNDLIKINSLLGFRVFNYEKFYNEAKLTPDKHLLFRTNSRLNRHTSLYKAYSRFTEIKLLSIKKTKKINKVSLRVKKINRIFLEIGKYLKYGRVNKPFELYFYTTNLGPMIGLYHYYILSNSLEALPLRFPFRNEFFPEKIKYNPWAYLFIGLRLGFLKLTTQETGYKDALIELGIFFERIKAMCSKLKITISPRKYYDDKINQFIGVGDFDEAIAMVLAFY